MSYSPYTKKAVSFVKNNPGCSKMDLASHLTYCSMRNPSKQYYLVNTQVRLGNIVALRARGRYFLFTPEDEPSFFEKWLMKRFA